MTKYSLLRHNRFGRKSLEDALKDYSIFVDGLVLDVGCGNKPFEDLFTCNEYIGLDVRGANVDTLGSVYMLPFKESSFDAVLFLQVIEHLQNPDVALKEIHRVLKVNGVFIMSFPQSWRIHGRYDYWRFTLQGMKFLLKKHGFKFVDAKIRGGVFKLVGQQIDNFLWFKFHIFAIPICVVNNVVFSLLDKLDVKKSDTLGYVILARKSAQIKSYSSIDGEL